MNNLNTESLSYWFFRLNGCFCLTNFLIHHEKKGFEGTEIDLLGVRFPFRQELAFSSKPIPDHRIFCTDHKIKLVIAEVKKNLCQINESLLNPKTQNLE